MNISFALTTDQVRRRIKTETRRLGWEKFTDHRQPCAILHGIVKGQGLKKGEHPEPITDVRIVRAWRERLDAITPEAVFREGFPNGGPEWFVNMFCQHNKCQPSTVITVLAFEYPWLVEFDAKHIILTGSYGEAVDMAMARGWSRHQWIYPTEPAQLAGLSAFNVHYVSTFLERSDRHAIRQTLSLRHRRTPDSIQWGTSAEFVRFKVEKQGFPAVSVKPVVSARPDYWVTNP